MSFEGEPVGIDSDVDLPLSSNSDSCVFIASVVFDRGETHTLEAPEQHTTIGVLRQELRVCSCSL